MANEKIVSPGVFTREKDLSYLPQGIGAIGAAFIGPTVKGPAFVPTIVESPADFVLQFGDVNELMYTPYSAKQYLEDAGIATIIRTLGLGGYALKAPISIILSGSYGEKLASFLHPTYVVTDGDADPLFEETILADSGSGSFGLLISGSFNTDSSKFTGYATNNNGTVYNCSLTAGSDSYIGDLFGFSPAGKDPVYNYALFKKTISASFAADPASAVIFSTGSIATPEWDFGTEYGAGTSPWITSQKVGGVATDLFKAVSLSDGTSTNYETKVVISNIVPAGSIPGSEYGSFLLTVRAVDQDKIANSPYTTTDSDLRPNVLETFDNLNFDPNSPNFIARRIGDKYLEVNSEGRVVTKGNYKNLSNYIRVETAEAVSVGALPVTLVPFGFRSPWSPIPDGIVQPDAVEYVLSQAINGVYNKRVVYGFDYDFSGTDNLSYLNALPKAAARSTGSNADFNLSDNTQHPDVHYPTAATAYSGSINLNSAETAESSRQFVVPFQGGFDGYRPNVQKRTGEYITAANTQGYDLSNNADGFNAYVKALFSISNTFQYDINLLAMPGVLHRLHSGITTRGIELCEDRADCFYIMDSTALGDNVLTAMDTISTIDSNYAATYYPWIKILDTTKNKPVWVPPSVLLPGVIAYNDKVAYEWFAPAGLNRGGLNTAIDVESSLNRDDMNSLYPARVNPIASFPNDGIVVWGQKTLQTKPSALDRVNVRRLLIASKKFIASSARYLTFENNTAVTRNRFLAIANPYFESVQQRQGLYSFRVVMNEENNTPDVIDRNILYGQIYLQPAKTSEFIVLDFNIEPTGTVFNG